MLHVDRFADGHMHAYAPKADTYRVFDKMVSLGVTDAALLAYTYIETGIDNNIVCLHYKADYQKMRLRTFGGLYYDPDLNNSIIPFKEQAELLLEMGCDGIKFLDMKPNYNLYCGCNMDDPVYDAMYDMLEAREIPLVCHIADPSAFWHRERMKPSAVAMGWCFEDPKFLTQQQCFDSLLHRLEKNPKLKLSLAHFGFLTERLELCHRICETYPNVLFDLAPAWEIFADFGRDVRGWRDFFQKYNHRILYGTDTATVHSDALVAARHRTVVEALSHDESELPIPHSPEAVMRGLDLDEESQRRICHDNYFSFMGPEPAPLNRPLIREHAGLILSIAQKNGDSAMIGTIRAALEDI